MLLLLQAGVQAGVQLGTWLRSGVKQHCVAAVAPAVAVLLKLWKIRGPRVCMLSQKFHACSFQCLLNWYSKHAVGIGLADWVIMHSGILVERGVSGGFTSN